MNRTQMEFSADLRMDAIVVHEVWEPTYITDRLATVISRTGNERLSE